MCVTHYPVVSIHAPTRSATADSERNRAHCEFQSTRPHGARRCAERAKMYKEKFQSTRPHGARLTVDVRNALPCCFNPRAHTERDRPYFCQSRNQEGFNPRAHTERDGATTAWQQCTRCFNPRAHTERDLTASPNSSTS